MHILDPPHIFCCHNIRSVRCSVLSPLPIRARPARYCPRKALPVPDVSTSHKEFSPVGLLVCSVTSVCRLPRRTSLVGLRATGDIVPAARRVSLLRRPLRPSMGLLLSLLSLLMSLLLPLPLVILLSSVVLLVRRLRAPIPIISELLLLLLSLDSAALPFVLLPMPLVMLLLSICCLRRRRLFPNSTVPKPLLLLLMVLPSAAPLPRCF